MCQGRHPRGLGSQAHSAARLRPRSVAGTDVQGRPPPLHLVLGWVSLLVGRAGSWRGDPDDAGSTGTCAQSATAGASLTPSQTLTAVPSDQLEPGTTRERGFQDMWFHLSQTQSRKHYAIRGDQSTMPPGEFLFSEIMYVAFFW